MKFKTITKASDLKVNHVYRNKSKMNHKLNAGDVFRVTQIDYQGYLCYAKSDAFYHNSGWIGDNYDIDVEHLGEWAHGKSISAGDKVVVLKEMADFADVHIGDVLTRTESPVGDYLANDLNSLGDPWVWRLNSYNLALLATDAEDEDEDKPTDKPVIYPAIVNGYWAILNRETDKGWKTSYPVGGKPEYGEPRRMDFHLADAQRHLDHWLAGNHDSLKVNYTLQPDDLVVELTTVEVKSPENSRLTHVKYSDGNDLNITRSSQGGVVVDMNSGDSVSIGKDKIIDFASDILRVAGLDPSKVSFSDKGQE